jgi:hypothetical protein
MQGRYIEHQALKALGCRERTSSVTWLRDKSTLVKDETVLIGIRGISNSPVLYTQYIKYRLEAHSPLVEEIAGARDREGALQYAEDQALPYDSEALH